jgi:photosystem II stability/assembly factor-like uncharacterized protein
LLRGVVKSKKYIEDEKNNNKSLVNSIMKTYQHVLVTIFLYLLNSYNCFSQELLWEPLGGPGGEPVGAMAIDSVGTIYAYSLGYGLANIVKSTDHGASWSKISDGIAANTIFIHPDGTIYIGSDIGICKSTDGGATWIQSSLTYQVVAFVLNQQGLIFALTKIYGVYFSVNNGQTWYPRNSGIGGSTFSCLVAHPNGSMFVGSSDMNGNVYRSTDNGKAWTQVSNGLPTNLMYWYIMDLTVATDGSLLLATGFNGIYRSTNNGDTWISVVGGGGCMTLTSSTNGMVYGAGHIDNSLSGGIIKSTDNGATWSNANWNNTRVYDIIIDRDQRVLASCVQGIGISSDSGSTWVMKKVFGRYYSVKAMDFDSKGTLFAAADHFYYADAGIYRSNDSGKTWIRTTIIQTSSYINGLEILKSGIMFYGISDTFTGGLFRSSDSGISWEKICTAGVFALGKDNDSIIYVCSQDGAFQYNENTKSVMKMGDFGWVYAITSKPGGKLFAGVNYYNGILFRSTDYGYTWAQDTNGIGSASITSLLTTLKGTILAGSAGFGIYRSTDDGTSWTHTSIQSGVCRILIQYFDGKVIAGNREGKIFESSNDGDTWNDISTGFPSGSITCIIQDHQGSLFAGTSEDGIFRALQTVNIVTTSHQNPKTYYLNQNYPNPFNPSTSISFSLSSKSFVSLKVFDIIGREVATLVNGELSAGNHTRQWNAVNMSSGVYFYRLQTGTFTDVKKLVLLR